MEMEQYVNSRNQISNQECFVNLGPDVRSNDFVFVRDESDENNQPKVARIVQIIDERAHVLWYYRQDQLPAGIKFKSESGFKINLHSNELIETENSENIELSKIFAKCHVFKTKETAPVLEILQMKKTKKMAYVCRYKLVKEQLTVYKLVPVSWQPGEEELEHSDGEISDSDLFDMDSEDKCENVVSLSTSINQLHLSLTSDSSKSGEQMVSPIKIIKKQSVEKVSRTRNQTSPNKRTSPDGDKANADVSPTKRNKLNHTPSKRSKSYASPVQKQMDSIRKNLNASFNGSTDGLPQSPFHSDTVHSPYDSQLKSDLKMTLTKRVLRERNENTEQSPAKNIANDTQMQRYTRRSILKTNSSKVDTPKRSVIIVEQPKEKDNRKIETESTPRRSSRRISMRTNDSIKAALIESSPELETPKKNRRSTAKAISVHSPPKSASKRTTAAKTPSTPKTPKGTTMTPQQTRSLYRSGGLTPSIQSRHERIAGEQTELEMIRERLQVSAVPASLPCREKEYASIYEFIMGKLTDGSGGCIYISGVPGTGKTATVSQVIKAIQKQSKPKKLPAFDYVDINGMRLTEPRQAYVQIYRQLTGKTLAWAQARDLLESRFSVGSKKAIRPTILLVDELDIICNRKQDVVYNLFDWTVRKGSRLIAITIANTMDLPERVLKLKVASRLGLTRITFQPYTFKQLQEVVMTRLSGSNCFMADAVQLVARKVASVSGDCRRALDICRRATEIAEEKSNGAEPILVNFGHINQALSEMFASPKVRAIKNCTKFEKLFLQAVASEIQRTGIEEVEFHRVFWQIGTLAQVLGMKNPPTEDQSMMICMALAANRLLIAEDSSTGHYQKIILNASVDDLYYALNVS